MRWQFFGYGKCDSISFLLWAITSNDQRSAVEGYFYSNVAIIRWFIHSFNDYVLRMYWITGGTDGMLWNIIDAISAKQIWCWNEYEKFHRSLFLYKCIRTNFTTNYQNLNQMVTWKKFGQR